MYQAFLKKVSSRKLIFAIQAPILAFASLLYVVNKLFLGPGWDSSSCIGFFLTGYFDDMLAPIVFFSLVNMSFSVSRVQMVYIMPLVMFTVIAGCFWEFIAPVFIEESVSDPADFVAYIVGTVVYWAATSFIRQQSNN